MKRHLAGFIIMSIIITLLTLFFVINAGAEEKPTITIPNLNASGDVGFLYHLGFVGGIGADLVSFKEGLITMRGQILWAVDNPTRDRNDSIMGVGLMVDIIKLATKSQGKWELGFIKPKVGAFTGYDFGNRRMDWGVVIQTIKIEF